MNIDQLQTGRAAPCEVRVKATTTKAEEGEPAITRFVASTASEDRDGDILDQESWRLDRYRDNPVIQWAHRYDLPPVGKAIRVEVGTDAEGRAQLEIDVQWDTAQELGATIARQYAEGYLSAGSVGFSAGIAIPRNRFEDDDPRRAEDGMFFANNELLEFSAVPVPANPEALAAKGLPMPADSPAAALQKYVDQRLAALPDRDDPPEVEASVDVRSEVLALLTDDDEVRALVKGASVTTDERPDDEAKVDAWAEWADVQDTDPMWTWSDWT